MAFIERVGCEGGAREPEPRDSFDNASRGVSGGFTVAEISWLASSRSISGHSLEARSDIRLAGVLGGNIAFPRGYSSCNQSSLTFWGGDTRLKMSNNTSWFELAGHFYSFI